MSDSKKNEKVNMKMLAAELGLSTATVSKALRDSYEISADTKNRVIAAARRLHYIPNPFASSLRNNRSHTIAIILPEIADSFFSQAINGIESIVSQHQYHALIYLTHESYQREVQMFDQLNSGRVDGVLLSISCETSDTTHIQNLLDTDLPVVLFDRVSEGLAAASVKTNDYDSAYQATLHLLTQGCKRISLLTINGFPAMLQLRAAGYQQALTDHKTDPQHSTILTCSSKSHEDNVALIKQHIKDNQPDGFVITVEHLATSAYLACKELEITIPDEIKVICFTNQPTASILQPPLSTVQQPAYEMGKQAAELLFQQLNGKQMNEQHLVLPSVLMIRTSSS